MKFFKMLFGKKDKQSNRSKNQKPRIEIVSVEVEQDNKPRKTVDEDFSTAKWVIEEALDKVFSKISIEKETENKFRKAYCDAHKSGLPRNQEKVAIAFFANSNWVWHDFNQWDEIFSKRNEWPYMWRRLKLTTKPDIKPPDTIEKAFRYLTVKEMREFLKKNEIKVKPAPKKSSEFEKAILKNASLNDVLSAIKSKFDTIAGHKKRDYAEAKCELLAHTLCMTAYALRDHHQRKILTNWKFFAEECDGTCIIEKEFVEKYNSGEIKGLPPFFPGDRISIGSVRE